MFEDAFTEGVEDVNIKFTLTKIIHPFGRCCQAIRPDKADYLKVLKFYVKIKLEKNLSDTKSFQMFLFKPGTAHILKLTDFNTFGNLIKTGSIEKGYRLFKVKLVENNHLQEDTKAHCYDYKKDSDYVKVENNLR